MNNEEYLKEQIFKLESENRKLKKLLEKAGISYELLLEEKESGEEKFDTDQALRILPMEITDTLANRFFSRFWGRQDVYAKRYVNKITGQAGYFPQCKNFWTYRCPRKNGKKIKCMDCNSRMWKKLEITEIRKHLEGMATDGSDVIGIYPLLSDDTCRFLVFDFDNHEKSVENRNDTNYNRKWKEEVEALWEICRLNQVECLVERSRSGSGVHVWILFEEPIEASLARKFGFALLEKGAQFVNLKSFTYYDRMLPAQDSLPDGGVGNLIALPLQGRALKNGNSAFVDENWNAYPNQWKILLNKRRLSREFVEKCIKIWQAENPFSSIENNEKTGTEGRTAPWKKSRKFCKEDVEGALHIVVSNMIYIDTVNLKPRIQNQIRKLAAFGNPVFYKNQKMGLSNYNNSRYIYLGRDEDGYIEIPRGLYDKLIEQCEEAGITIEEQDLRVDGKSIKVEFAGELREEQKIAEEKLLKYENGILSAATAFGKTVVCSKMIAERKTNTLILLESSALTVQWEEALNKFLTIDEELPEYQTPTGRVKRRKSVIGKLQGPHDSTTGMIDIAMVGSVCKNGEMHHRLCDYGMVLVDECHHAASDTIVKILMEVKAKYVYGVTATPMRGDGLEKINDMLIGPIRHRYTAKEMVKNQEIRHLVYPRFTPVVSPHRLAEKLYVNDAYEMIRMHELRNKQIVQDIKECIKNGRTPVVLSKYKDHATALFHQLKDCSDYIFLLLGGKSKKEQREIRSQMKKVESDKSLILVATGQLIGEGFDYPRLDTLIMATPVSGRNVVEQYAGRLNRNYEGKKDVIIFDYVDGHLPVFEKMYGKRLRAYKQIGYEICTDIKQEKQEVNAIFDMDTYLEVYQRDLTEAEEEIVISSPRLSREKVQQLICTLRERMKRGLVATIVTWYPDAYKYGQSENRMNLLEALRRAGFQIRLVEENCEHYAIIDSEIVWYGSMNLLSKEDAEDNLMRVKSKKIAQELLEISFGNDKQLEEW